MNKIEGYKGLDRALKVALLLLVLLFGLTVNAVWAQEPTVKDRVLKDTVIKTITYKMYIGSRGGRYVLKTSKNGVIYKMYCTDKKK